MATESSYLQGRILCAMLLHSLVPFKSKSGRSPSATESLLAPGEVPEGQDAANPEGEVQPVGTDVDGLAEGCRNPGGDVISLGEKVENLVGDVAKLGEEVGSPGGGVCGAGVEGVTPGVNGVQVPMNPQRPGGAVVDRPAGVADQAAAGSGTVRVPRGPGKRWRRSSYTSCA
ncbi:MAG: hypothetical protein WBG33_08700, partial [Rhodanobacter sp.]